MKAHYMGIFLILSLVGADFIGEEQTRRILHQPLFPVTSSSSPPPPPESESPPPPATPDSLNPDQPFFHQLPNGPTGPQTRPAPAGGSSAANSVAAQQSKLIKKLAIAITSTILTLGILTAFAFYVYKRRKNHQDESQKVFDGSHRTNNEESTMLPSNFLYIGTVEPSARSLVNENDSPYRKPNSGKRSERYRPSPELQPMPPLPKPPPPNSPPPMSSCSDDDSSDTNFYTPQMSNESFGSSNGYLNNVISQLNQTMPPDNGSVPRSKRTSRKSLLTASSSMDRKPVMIPSSIKQSFIPPRPKFSAPPAPPDMARLQSISSEDQHIRKIPCAPPPPPPLPSKSSKLGVVEAHTPLSMSKQAMGPQMKSDSPKATPRTVKGSPSKNGVTSSSSEKSGVEENDGSKPKLKPLHWDKVRTNADQATVWDQIKSSSFQLNEDAMETLFGCNSVNSVPKEAIRKCTSLEQEENRVLDPKKSQNIAILLRALNVTTEEVTKALLDGNPEGLGPELLETLVKMAPTKEEEIKLKDYDGETSKLGSAERFLKAILDVPFAFKRVEAMLYRANFDTEVKYLRNSFNALEEASEELKNSRLFLKLLEAVLRTGNRMNDGTNRGDAKAFKLDTLLKLVDIKGTDGKTTLLHFVVQEITRSEGTGSNPENESIPNTNFKFKEEEFKKQGLQVVSGLSKELCNVKKAAGMDSDVLSSYVSKVEMGLEKLRLVEKQTMQDKFFVSMKEFLNEAIDEISKVKAEEKKALSHVKEVTQYFHGDAAKEEAHPFRIFTIVRDFLSVLDNVCKDVGRMQDRTTVGAGRSFRIPATVSLPVLNRFNVRRDTSSDGDSM